MDLQSHAFFSILVQMFYNIKTKTKQKKFLIAQLTYISDFILVLINQLNTNLQSSNFLALVLPLCLFLLQRPLAP